MTPHQHVLHLGKLLANFQILETWLRTALLKHSASHHAAAQLDFEKMPVGSVLSANPMTDYAQLRELIRKFNQHQASQSKPPLDEGLVDVRDALAHGRVIAGSSSGYPMRLLKFSKPMKGTSEVKVEFNEILGKAWFVTQVLRTHAAIQVVVRDVQA